MKYQNHYNWCIKCGESHTSLHKSGICKKCRSRKCDKCEKDFEIMKSGQITCYKCRSKYRPKKQDELDNNYAGV